MAEGYLLCLKKDLEVYSSGVLADFYREENISIPAYVDRFLKNHNIEVALKSSPSQLTQGRLDRGDVTVCINQAVFEECSRLFIMPKNTLVWDIADYNEQKGSGSKELDAYTEAMFKQIKAEVDDLLKSLN